MLLASGAIPDPTDLHLRIQSYAAEAVPDCSPERITAVSRFSSGERHTVYKVSYLDPRGRADAVVVRIASSDETRDCAQAEREAAVLTEVQGIAAPRLYDFRCESRWFDAPTTCTQFISGEQLDMAVVAPSEVERLGAVVAEVHALPADDLRTWFPTPLTRAAYLDDRLDVIARKLTSVRDPMPAATQRRLQDAWRLVAASHDRGQGESLDGELVLQHGDVAAGNVVWGDTPVLIDWEYARLGDPADEIAYIFGQNDLGAAQRAAFWRGYRGGRGAGQDDEMSERVRWWEPVNLLGSALWWVERWAERSDADTTGEANSSVSKPQDYYLQHALQRLDRFERQAHGGPTP